MYMKNDFVKFIVTILIFFVSIILCDRIVAFVENKLYLLQDTKVNYAHQNKVVADIVILGSSRASHHYVPHIITDSLGLTCVNLGEDGQGILYNYPIAHMVMKNNCLCGVMEKSKHSTNEFEKYLEETFTKNGIKGVSVKIFEHSLAEKYFNRIEELKRLEYSKSVMEEEVIRLLFDISY